MEVNEVENRKSVKSTKPKANFALQFMGVYPLLSLLHAGALHPDGGLGVLSLVPLLSHFQALPGDTAEVENIIPCWDGQPPKVSAGYMNILCVMRPVRIQETGAL